MAWGTSVALMVGIGIGIYRGASKPEMKENSPPGRSDAALIDTGRRTMRAVTFTEDVAPVLFQQCTPCHRPGQRFPFGLATYQDVVGKADRILAAVTSRRMPPWQADPMCGPFANARLLTTNEIAVFTDWAALGKPEGDPRRLPALPDFTSGWRLGAPDLIASAPAAFRLQPSTNDTYYNMVVPLALDRPRYVRAVEFSPGIAGLVHHAFLRFDRSGRCRKLSAENQGVGFAGLHLPAGAFSSDSQFLSWQPGRAPSEVPVGLAWRLQPGTDLILQLHLSPVSQAYGVQPSVAFYFTDEPPKRHGYKVRLTSFTFTIPAGARDFVVREEFTTPIASQLVALLPHAHRLARRVTVTTTAPGESARRVLEIPRWDFDWQTDYNLRPELTLPAGTKLAVEFSYDNPSSRPVSYGPNTSDEMAELWVLLAVDSAAGVMALGKAESPLVIRDTIAYNEYLLRSDPGDWRARLQVANALLTRRDASGALVQLERAVATAPNEAEPHYWSGYALRELKRMDEAAREFGEAVRCDPSNGAAHGSLGWILLAQRRLEAAAAEFRRALEIDPHDALARRGLAASSSGTPAR